MPTQTLTFLLALDAIGLDQITMLGTAFFADKTLGGLRMRSLQACPPTTLSRPLSFANRESL